MEPIQKAIERARQEREGRIGKLQTPAESSGYVEPGIRDAQKSAPKQEARISVTYSQTQVQALAEQDLLPRKLVAAIPNDKRGEPYRQLRTQVLKKLKEKGWNTLAVVSPNDGAGSTLTSANLAVSLAREYTHTVLLVDMDIAQPSVAQVLGLDVDKGLADYLEGSCTLQETLVHPGLDRLVVLPGVPRSTYSSEVVSSPEMKELFKDLKERYESRIVIFDMPAVLRNDDAIAFLPRVDAVLLVVEEGGTTKDDLRRAMRLLDGCNVIGSVLNKVRES